MLQHVERTPPWLGPVAVVACLALGCTPGRDPDTSASGTGGVAQSGSGGASGGSTGGSGATSAGGATGSGGLTGVGRRKRDWWNGRCEHCVYGRCHGFRRCHRIRRCHWLCWGDRLRRRQGRGRCQRFRRGDRNRRQRRFKGADLSLHPLVLRRRQQSCVRSHDLHLKRRPELDPAFRHRVHGSNRFHARSQHHETHRWQVLRCLHHAPGPELL